ncbi:MAG: methyltransferase domain-containing protein, partial [Sphingobium sp.]
MNYLKGQVLYRLGLNAHQSGATHSYLGIEQSVDYVNRVVDDYLHYAGVAAHDLAGLDVLEVGPGDNFGVALALLAKGAKTVTCLDRFEPLRDDRRNTDIYRRLLESWSPEERRRAADVVRFEGDRASFDPERIVGRYGLSIEQAPQRIEQTFDVILSRAVLEHVGDVPAAWDAMVRLLKPTGQMWHKVDFRNHGKFDQFHPLYFLTIGERRWRLLTSPDPTLNRERLPTYRRLAEQTFQTHRLFVTHILQGDELVPHVERLEFGKQYGDAELSAVAAVRPRLDARFRDVSDEDLLPGG